MRSSMRNFRGLTGSFMQTFFPNPNRIMLMPAGTCPSQTRSCARRFSAPTARRIALLLCFATLPGFAAPLQFGGGPVELTVSEISEHAVRLEVKSLAESGPPRAAAESPMLAPFPVKKKFSTRELTKDREIRSGDLRVTLKASPLSATVRRADGTVVQELVFGGNDLTNEISFAAAATVLGLGEGADQFDRRVANYPPINGQRYRLADLGTRIFSPYLIGTDGWALWFNGPSAGVDLRGGRGVARLRRGFGADVVVIDARDPADAMREFIRLTGAPVLPPKWALGYMQSHRTLASEADILAEARMFREKNLPCDTFIFLGTGFCPAGWNFGHDSFQFNTNVFTRGAA